MKYTIPRSNIKIFHKSLLSLRKVADELSFEPCLDKLLIKAFNSSKTGFYVYTFLGSFFTCIEGQIDQESAEPFRCKVQLKSLFLAFTSVFNTEKTVESCQLEIKQDCQSINIIKICRYEVISKFSLPTLEHDIPRVDYNPVGKSHCLLNCKLLLELVGTFRQSQEETTISVTPEGFQMKNYIDETEDSQVNTELSMNPDEFDSYDIQENAVITFSLKDLRSLISFAEATWLPVKATFSVGGSPITFSIQQDAVLEVTYALATLPDAHSETHKFIHTPMQQNSVSRIRAAASVSQDSVSSVITTKGHNNTTERVNFDESAPNHSYQLDESGNLPDARKRPSDLFNFEGGNGNGDIRLTPQQPSRKEEVIPGSPQQTSARKRPWAFRKCFDSTYNPNILPPGARILAVDSDNEEEM